MIAQEIQQDEQPHGAKVLSEDLQSRAVVNGALSDDLLATPITREKKTILGAGESIGSHGVGIDPDRCE